ncbi:MAG: lipid-A-disaccharide synthase [Marinoscillum sp.]|jgi:lipid-A-disaccharide synthase
MKIFFLAGEHSGDLHASAVSNELKLQDSDVTLVGWGGDAMHNAGVVILRHFNTFQAIGISSVIKQIFKFRSLFKECCRCIEEIKPDAVVLVDFAGFNLRIARFAKKQGIKVVYYIPPKVWAWMPSRVKWLQKYVDLTLVIFPFEKDFLEQHRVNTVYVGNPTLKSVEGYLPDNEFIKLYHERKPIVFLPGSRPSEIKKMIPIISSLAEMLAERKFLVAGISNVEWALYDGIIGLSNVEVVFDRTFDLLHSSSVSIVTSGTATLEAALLGAPQVVVYKTSALNYFIARLLIKVEFISLVNLLLNRTLVSELIQSSCTAERIGQEIERLESNEVMQKKISEGYSEIKDTLIFKNQSESAASAILKLCRS